jgi:prophage regulatory protein
MLNRYRSEGRFPAAIPLGDRRIAFVRQEVMQWIADKIEAARATTAQQPQSPWDDPTFSISGKSIYRTRGFIDTAA